MSQIVCARLKLDNDNVILTGMFISILSSPVLKDMVEPGSWASWNSSSSSSSLSRELPPATIKLITQTAFEMFKFVYVFRVNRVYDTDCRRACLRGRR